MQNLINKTCEEYLSGKCTLRKLCIINKVNYEAVKAKLKEDGFIIKSGYKLQTVIALKYGVQEYIDNINNKPSLTKIADKYKVNKKLLSDRLKELGYEIINYQNETKFNENIFDSIDTEEKAYWLGFIYADGYISSNDCNFELSLCEQDIDHLIKFNKFMQHQNNNVKINDTKLNDKYFKRCRWSVRNKHLWNTLNNYGCTPRKSLTLEFPDENIFKDKSLIRHFIRGYFDGDGCISYANKEHSKVHVSFLGTEDFLTSVKLNLPLEHNYVLGFNTKQSITRVLSIIGTNGFRLLFYLYENSNIYLDRKYDKYKQNCRLYKELYRELQTKIGESCDANPEVNSEIKKSESPYSVEIEPEISE